MPDVPALERMRAIRRDSYRCQHRNDRGRPCLKPTSHAVYTADGEVVTVCREEPHP